MLSNVLHTCIFIGLLTPNIEPKMWGVRTVIYVRTKQCYSNSNFRRVWVGIISSLTPFEGYKANMVLNHTCFYSVNCNQDPDETPRFVMSHLNLRCLEIFPFADHLLMH